MNYDKNSFLAGIAVGRQLKGWNLFPESASVQGWTASPAYLWSNPGLIGHIPASVVLTYQDVGYVGGYFDRFEGNIIEGIGYNTCFISYRTVPGNIPKLFDITVTKASARGFSMSYYNSPSWVSEPIEGTGIFVTTPSGVRADGIGRGTVKAVLENVYLSEFATVGGAGNDKTNIYINAVYANERCVVPGGNSYWKKKPGLCVVCLAKYLNAAGMQISTPVLISDLQQATEWSYFNGGVAQTANTGLYTYHGRSWYMSTSGELDTQNPQSSTGAVVLDLTSLGNLQNEQDLFLAVCNAAGLAVQ